MHFILFGPCLIFVFKLLVTVQVCGIVINVCLFVEVFIFDALVLRNLFCDFIHKVLEFFLIFMQGFVCHFNPVLQCCNLIGILMDLMFKVDVNMLLSL